MRKHVVLREVAWCYGGLRVGGRCRRRWWWWRHEVFVHEVAKGDDFLCPAFVDVATSDFDGDEAAAAESLGEQVRRAIPWSLGACGPVLDCILDDERRWPDRWVCGLVQVFFEAAKRWCSDSFNGARYWRHKGVGVGKCVSCLDCLVEALSALRCLFLSALLC